MKKPIFSQICLKMVFCSVYCLREIARNYGINFDMLVDVEYQVTPNSDRLLHDAKYQFYPVYLVEKTAEKLIIKTKLGNVGAAAKEVDVSIILEKQMENGYVQ